jgi:glycerophosphoryl diester phosphodiesterase
VYVILARDEAQLRRSAQGGALVSAHAGADGEEILGLTHYESGISTGADYVEVDVRRTADGVLVAHHDPVVKGRTLNRVTYSELRKLASSIPRVTDVIQLAKGRVRLHVDIKDAAVERSVLALLGDVLDSDGFIVTSLDDDVVATVKTLWPQVRAGLSIGRDDPSPLLRTRLSELRPLPRAERCGADFLAAHQRLARFGVLRQAADRDMPVFVWTVNDKAALTRLLADARATGIVTDVPALAVALRRNALAQRT